MKKPAWSYTSLTAYETCPKRYYLTRVSKEVREPQTTATTWGNAVHKAMELRVKDKTPLPSDMVQWAHIAAKLDTAVGQIHTEQKFTLDAHMRPTSWFADNAWLRCILDVTVDKGRSAAVLDYKTGKRKTDSDQMMLFAGVLMQTQPLIDKVSTAFIWLKDGKTDSKVFTRPQLPEIWGEFMPRVQRLEHAHEFNKWEARPSGLCREWCPVGKALCAHCGKP
jgi:PD-(D/E)XK nuclease superfamily